MRANLLVLNGFQFAAHFSEPSTFQNVTEQNGTEWNGMERKGTEWKGTECLSSFSCEHLLQILFHFGQASHNSIPFRSRVDGGLSLHKIAYI